MPLRSAPLGIDGLGQVVADRLRLRSAPGVGPSSEKLEPLLERGTVLFVIAGPVAASGYRWYMVAPVDDRVDEFRYRAAVDPIGWVADADRDGTTWLAGVSVDCPDPASFFEDLSGLEHLGPLMTLSCYGGLDLSFRGTPVKSGFIDGYGPETFSPGWLLLAEMFRSWTSPDYGNHVTLDEPFETALDPNRFPGGPPPELQIGSDWDVVGHFDDPAAAGCRIDDPEHARPIPIDSAAVILMCRTTFVATSLTQFQGIDPG